MTGKIMKKLALLLAVILLFSCRQGDVVDKPDNLIDDDKMADVLYDLALLQSMRSQTNTVLEENNIDPKLYVFRKYNIDSLTFVQSHRYYASRLEEYEKIQKKVKEKLLASKEKISPAKVKSPSQVQDITKDTTAVKQ